MDSFRSPGRTPEETGLKHALTGRLGLPDESVLESLQLRLLAPNVH